MFKINLPAFLKALSSLAIPTLSICIFTFFLVLDLQKLIEIVFGSKWYSILLRLFIIITELVLFITMYRYHLRQSNIKIIKEVIDNPESFTNKIKTSTHVSIRKDRYNDYTFSNGSSKRFLDSLHIDIKDNNHNNKVNDINVYELSNEQFLNVNIDLSENDGKVINVDGKNIKYFLIKTEVLN